MIPVDVMEVVGNDRRKLGTVSLYAIPRKSEQVQLPDGALLDVITVRHVVTAEGPARPQVDVVRFGQPLKPGDHHD